MTDYHYLVCRLGSEWHMVPEGHFRISRNLHGYQISLDGRNFRRIYESDYELHSFKHTLVMLSDKNLNRTKKSEFCEAS